MKIKSKESGITLIALIITVIILVILAAVSIAALGGDDDIINTAFDASKDYSNLNNEQQIYQLAENIIKEYEVRGQDISLSAMAQKLSEQDWIQTATADGDIIITTTKGDVYQLYYNQQYGQRFVEFIGKADENEFPSITATYNSETKNIQINSSAAQRIELRFNGEIVKAVNSTSLDYTAANTGWYTAKVKSSNGKIKYAWIRASIQDISVKLEITSFGLSENCWYGKDDVPVQVTISTNGSEIYYKLETDENYTHVEDDNIDVIIGDDNEEIGKTTIYAYSVDSSGRQSDVSKITVKYDNVNPSIDEIEISGNEIESGVYDSNIEISLHMSDTTSGIEGYSYWLTDESPIYLQGNRNLTISSEGAKEINFQAKDKAGNLSDVETITVERVNLE